MSAPVYLAFRDLAMDCTIDLDLAAYMYARDVADGIVSADDTPFFTWCDMTGLVELGFTDSDEYLAAIGMLVEGVAA